jgi:chromosome segregation ATPase
MAVRKTIELGEGQQTIEELQARYQDLNTKKIQCATRLDTARQTLENLKNEARAKYGTDNLAALQEKLAQMRKDNEQKRASYQAELDRIQADLDRVEQSFRATEAGAVKG